MMSVALLLSDFVGLPAQTKVTRCARRKVAARVAPKLLLSLIFLVLHAFQEIWERYKLFLPKTDFLVDMLQLRRDALNCPRSSVECREWMSIVVAWPSLFVCFLVPALSSLFLGRLGGKWIFLVLLMSSEL
jgi:hypothetical protein